MDPTSKDHQELDQIEAIEELLEDFWFFDNLLDRRSRILRYCHSDPYPSPSSTYHPEPESPNIGDSGSGKTLIEASPGSDSIPPPPPTPPCVEGKEDGGEAEKKKIKKMKKQFSEKIRVQERITYLQKKEPVVREKGIIKEGSRKIKSGSTSSSCNNNMGGSLQRTQTLPSYIGREDDGYEFQDQEIDDSRMGFLIREAIASGLTPTKQNIPKISSIPRHRPPRKMLSNIETKEIMKLKDLDIGSDSKEEERRKVPRAAVKIRSTAVVGQRIPVWVPKDSGSDMKAQIKYWARTVASNVRQEC